MKRHLIPLYCLFACALTLGAQENTGDDDVLIIRAPKTATPPPLFFTATEEARVLVDDKRVTQSLDLSLTILQGQAKNLTLELLGDGVVTKVEGPEILSWAVKYGGENDKQRFLQLFPSEPNQSVEAPREVKATVHLESPNTITTLAPGEAISLSGLVDVNAGDTVDLDITAEGNAIPAALNESRRWRYQIQGRHSFQLDRRSRAAAPSAISFEHVQLRGTADAAQRLLVARLTTEVIVREVPNEPIALLSGNVAPHELPALSGARLRLVRQGDQLIYALAVKDPGTYPIDLTFDVPIQQNGETRFFSFQGPASALTSLILDGLPADVRFDASRPVYPTPDQGRWLGFLPANGKAEVAWSLQGAPGERKVFFATDSVAQVTVGAGMIRQEIHLGVSVLQGKLPELNVALAGIGEIVEVQATNLLEWSVSEENRLTIRFSQPLTAKEVLTLRTQTPTGTFPATINPLRLTPDGTVRHSGFLRFVNDGAVRLALADTRGLTQLEPSRFPSEGFATPSPDRQTLVYRHPSTDFDYALQASQIVPEISVSQILLYEMTASDRVITANLELDIREAPIREWTLNVPEGFAVSSAQGANVSDTRLSDQNIDGYRSLSIAFTSEVLGRQLVELRLERNDPAAQGAWTLVPLTFPDAKNVRGHVGVLTAPGFRTINPQVEQLTEIPLALFPKQGLRLQQAYRLRDPNWSATVTVDALAQTVQADLFHLYSLKEGMAYGSVLVNYFVGGAPVSEWTLEVPPDAGNIAIDGQHVQGWSQNGNLITVNLHQAILGTASVALTYEQPLQTPGGILKPGLVRPENVQGERGYIQLTSPYQLSLETTKASAGLLSVEASELPAEYRLFTSAPTLAAYQYTARPFELELNLRWFETADMADQLVDFATLTSQVSHDGQVVTEASFYVKSRNQNTLRLRLPSGARLWDVTVDGAPVSARTDGDITVVPLIANADPTKSLQVVLRLGESVGKGKILHLTAPAVMAATVTSRWRVTADPGRILRPVNDSASALSKAILRETGIDWFTHSITHNQHHWLGMLLGAITLAGIVRWRALSRWRLVLSAFCALLALVLSLLLAGKAMQSHRAIESSSDFVMTTLAAGAPATLELKSMPVWEAMLSWPGIVLGLVGMAFILVGCRWRKHERVGWCSLGFSATGMGLLLQQDGAVAFFIWLGAFLLVAFARGVHRHWRALGTGLLATPTATAIVVISLSLLCSPETLRASEPSLLADTLTQTWRIENGRLYGAFTLQVDGTKDDTLLLLRDPAILTSFESTKARALRPEQAGNTAYWIVLDDDGHHEVKGQFEMSLSNPLTDFTLPTGLAALQQIALHLEDSGWEISSPLMVKSTPLDQGEGAKLWLGAKGDPIIQLKPRTRDVANEDTRFFTETSNLYVPNPGVIDGLHRLILRPAHGQITQLKMTIPIGFTLSDVLGGPVHTWQFDPETRTANVQLDPPQSTAFSIIMATQRPLSELPVAILLEPLRVAQAANDTGMIALASGVDAQADGFAAEGFPQVNAADFDLNWLGEKATKPPLQRVYRYGQEPGNLSFRVLPVEPEVRVETRQTLSLSEERLVLAVDLSATIAKAGIFHLSFPLPAGLEVEAISGPILSHWAETSENEQRVITLHFKERALGEQRFSLTLAGTAPGPQDAWSVPRLSIREAGRQLGQAIIVPERGLRVQVSERNGVSPIDIRNAEGGTARSQPGTLAFRLLEPNWTLSLRLEALEPWITAQALQEVTVREGLTRTRLAILLNIDNAAVNEVTLRLPNLTVEEAKSMRVTGDAVSGVAPVAGQPGLWSLSFQRRILGRTAVEIRHQRTGDRPTSTEEIGLAQFQNLRQLDQWLSVRAAGRLEVSVVDQLDSGWQRADWPSVPDSLMDAQEKNAPALLFRAASPATSLQVAVRRHDLADALKLRVASGELVTCFSLKGQSLTEARLQIEVNENSALDLSLPAGASLLNARVNGESVSVAHVGPSFRLTVSPPEGGGQADVQFVYGVSLAQSAPTKVSLLGPRLSAPLQNVTWRIVVPNGYRFDDADGDLELTEAIWLDRLELDDYLLASNQEQSAAKESALDLVAQANTWIAQGAQVKAREALRSASRAPSDASTNEDARVQLRQLQNEQAVMGLNTLRQRLYLDNRQETETLPDSEAMDRAILQNGLLTGDLNFNRDDFSRVLQANTQDENEALKRIANQLVAQQLAAEPALRSIDTTLPQQGQVIAFQRGVQVNGGEALHLDLSLRRETDASWLLLGILTMGLAVFGHCCLRASGMAKEAALTKDPKHDRTPTAETAV